MLHEALDHHQAGAADGRCRTGKRTECHDRCTHRRAKRPHADSSVAVKPAQAPPRLALRPLLGACVRAACSDASGDLLVLLANEEGRGPGVGLLSAMGASLNETSKQLLRCKQKA